MISKYFICVLCATSPHTRIFPDIYEEEIHIDPKLHNTLIGAKGRIIRSIIDESGSVQVRFPSADNPSEKVSIRGELVFREGATSTYTTVPCRVYLIFQVD